MKIKTRRFTAPMLAVASPIEKIPLPAYATPKLDGIRMQTKAPTREGQKSTAVSRNFKPIQNKMIREWIEANLPPGLDCEIITYFKGPKGSKKWGKMKPFNLISSDVANRNRYVGRFKIFVFDYVSSDQALNHGYLTRIEELRALLLPEQFTKKVLPKKCATLKALAEYEQWCVEAGFEGTMTRTGDSIYKCGRSTLKSGWLLKLKRFTDGEGILFGMEELLHNDNVATKDAFGRSERSSHKANKRASGYMGKLIVLFERKDKKAVKQWVVRIGTGYTLKQRRWFWENRTKMIEDALLVKFKYQSSGMKDRPRFPVYVGIRESFDL